MKELEDASLKVFGTIHVKEKKALGLNRGISKGPTYLSRLMTKCLMK